MSWAELNKDYTRVSPAFKCPMCGKADGCLVRRDGSHVICYHVQSSRMWKIGFLHRLSHEKASEARKSMVSAPKEVGIYQPDFERLHKVYRAAITQDKVDALAQQLGVSPVALNDLGIGWSNNYNAYTFPMRNEKCRVTGIQTRGQDGSKRALKGSLAGVFISTSMILLANPGVVFITEGVSDTATALTIGLHVIGRFNDVSGTDQLTSLLSNKTVFVIADNSGPEIQGAASLCEQLRSVTRYSGMIVLPFSVKDLRESLNTFGCTNTLDIIYRQVQEQLV